jgi:hypothetical protein
LGAIRGGKLTQKQPVGAPKTRARSKYSRRNSIEAKTPSVAAASERFWWGDFSFALPHLLKKPPKKEKSPHQRKRRWGDFSSAP